VANKKKQSGISLTEILVVVGIIAVLMGIPAAKQLAGSFETGTGVRQLINAALSNARAIAVREQTYAGVRFQENKDGNSYMIFIVHDNAATGLANGFRAVMGRKPMQLPENVSVTATVVDLTNNITGSHDFFSVIFSGAGKLTVHPNHCHASSANDTIFGATAMFEEDAVDWSSVQSFTIKTKDGNETTEYISPYTGELVMEYRQQNP
jgi:Tfp pilus assembly protein FimT